MKKKILALCVCVSMLAIAVIGGTVAYFTDTDLASNTFTVGSVKILLDEAPVSKDGYRYVADFTADRISGNKYELIYPGAVLPKDPVVHNIGKNDAYVRVKISITNGIVFLPTVADNDTYSETLYIEVFMNLIGGKLGEGWAVTDSSDGLEAILSGETTYEITVTYTEKLAAKNDGDTDDTTPVFENLYIPTSWSQDDSRISLIQENGFNMTVTAEAIQAEGFDSAEAAFAAYDGEAANN